MKVAIVHDDLVQWGGAERVLLGLSEIYPDAPIFTSVFDYSNSLLLQNFGKKKIITSFLQKIPGWRFLYKALMPLYPIAFEQFCFDEYDLVISHTTRFAKSIITKPQTRHVCFCHTPPRFLWHFSGLGNWRLGELLMSNLRIYDSVCSQRVDYFIAGSENAKRRIKRVYGKDCVVIRPFVDLVSVKNIDSFEGGYFVVMGRANFYKRFDLAREACRRVDIPLKEVSGQFSDEMVIKILSGCKALIIPGIEDFGLVGLEAQALGKPVIAYAEGGSLESVVDGKTGVFFKEQTVESLTGAIKYFESKRFDPKSCKQNAARFSIEIFQKAIKQTIASLL